MTMYDLPSCLWPPELFIARRRGSSVEKRGLVGIGSYDDAYSDSKDPACRRQQSVQLDGIDVAGEQIGNHSQRPLSVRPSSKTNRMLT